MSKTSDYLLDNKITQVDQPRGRLVLTLENGRMLVITALSTRNGARLDYAFYEPHHVEALGVLDPRMRSRDTIE